MPVHILDSIGCCVAALGAGPIEACRAQVADFGGDGPCALIGGGKANPIYAAFWHTALVRYVDFMDNFLAPTETCHTADNFGVALTITDYAGGSGRDLMLAVALSYTVQSRFVDHANFMTRGFDHTTQLAFSLNAAAGLILGMSEAQIANAIAMAAVSDASFAVVRAKPLSQWKGLASAQSALEAMNTLFLARRGVQGPLQVIEGRNGIDNLLHMQVRIDWDKEGYEGVLESTIKKYNAMIHTQSAVHCMVELVRQGNVDASKVVSIEADVTRMTYDFSGGGLYGMDKVVTTKEQADHNLPYLPSVSVSCQVCVPEHIRFGFQIFQPVPDDIADADDADELAVGNRGQMPHAVMRHQAHGALEVVGRGDRDDGMVHDVAHRHGERPLAIPRNGEDDVALRDQAGDGIAALHHQRGDPALPHPVAGALDGLGAVDGDDLTGAIAIQNVLNAHVLTPFGRRRGRTFKATLPRTRRDLSISQPYRAGAMMVGTGRDGRTLAPTSARH